MSPGVIELLLALSLSPKIHICVHECVQFPFLIFSAFQVCGQNADGGNIQNGCGHRFGWDSAPKYVKKEWNAHLEDAALKGYGDEKSHEYWKCDICDQDIKGSRFRCLHCPVFNLCQMCEAEFPHFPKHQFAIIK